MINESLYNSIKKELSNLKGSVTRMQNNNKLSQNRIVKEDALRDIKSILNHRKLSSNTITDEEYVDIVNRINQMKEESINAKKLDRRTGKLINFDENIFVTDFASYRLAHALLERSGGSDKYYAVCDALGISKDGRKGGKKDYEDVIAELGEEVERYREYAEDNGIHLTV